MVNRMLNVWSYPNSWLVYFMEHPIKMDENCGVPQIQWGLGRNWIGDGLVKNG